MDNKEIKKRILLIFLAFLISLPIMGFTFNQVMDEISSSFQINVTSSYRPPDPISSDPKIRILKFLLPYPKLKIKPILTYVVEAALIALFNFSMILLKSYNA